MDDKLKFQYKLVDISNVNLKQAEDSKKEMLMEVTSSDLLSATLKVHMYIEHELNMLYEYFFSESQAFIRLNFASKLKVIHEMGILPKDLFDVINVLNKIRNDFAHKLNFHKNNESYSRLLSSLGSELKQYHDIEVKMRAMVYNDLSYEEKYKILLAQIWIQVVIFCSTKERRKMMFGEKLISEVKTDVEKIESD